MSAIQLRILVTGMFYLFIFLSGIWLNRSDKPYNGIILTIHKLVSLGTIVFLAITIRRIFQASALSTVEIIVTIITGLFFLGTMITGGMLSVRRPMPKAVIRLHRITPLLTVLSTAVTLYLLFECKL
jgi:hypothetical protein